MTNQLETLELAREYFARVRESLFGELPYDDPELRDFDFWVRQANRVMETADPKARRLIYREWRAAIEEELGREILLARRLGVHPVQFLFLDSGSECELSVIKEDAKKMTTNCLCERYMVQLNRLYGEGIASRSTCKREGKGESYLIHVAYEDKSSGKIILDDADSYTAQQMNTMVTNLEARRA